MLAICGLTRGFDLSGFSLVPGRSQGDVPPDVPRSNPVDPLDPPGRGVGSYRSSELVFRAGVVFADVRFVQLVAWCVVPQMVPGAGSVWVDTQVSAAWAGGEDRDYLLSGPAGFCPQETEG